MLQDGRTDWGGGRRWMLQKLVGLGTVLMPAVVLSITSDAHNVYNRLVQCYYRFYHTIVDAMRK